MQPSASFLRILDANANRALEGLRVCEEIVRFHFNSKRYFQKLRALRHGVAKTMRRLPVSTLSLLQARESLKDVGRTARSGRIHSLENLLLINFQRAKEALRTLEETSRLLKQEVASDFQRLRFRTYEVEREILLQVAALRHSRSLRLHRKKLD
ncbi:MAG: thiamine-phosphate pyrophosphorylase [Candidatus Omnitrophica bacterium]|nr:thiamine-phosphate pyrophosphorylase [Candidatus Omnitrophota bacterium]